MKYIDLKTNSVISKSELQRKLNTSFPSDYIPEGYGKYVEPEVPSDIKEAARLKAKRDLGQYEPIEVDGMVFDADQQSQKNIETAIKKFDLLATNGYIPWTLFDNSIQPLTKEQLVSVENAIVLRYLQMHKEYTEFKINNL